MARALQNDSNKGTMDTEINLPFQVRVPATPLKPRHCRRFLRNTLAEACPAIVQGFIIEAAKGSCQHLKMLIEITETAPSTRRKNGIADKLFEDLARANALPVAEVEFTPG